MADPASLLSLFLFAEIDGVIESTTVSFSFLNLLVVVLLVLANGFFVASEFALVAVRKSRIEASAAEGEPAAIKLLAMLNDLNAYISATQLGITLSSLALGWVGEPAVASILEPALIGLGNATGVEMLTSGAVLHTVSFGISFSIITFLHIVFGELAPKTAALEISERISYLIAPPLKLFYRIFYYPIRLLDWAGTKTVRLFGLTGGEDHSASYTEEEIRQLLNVSHASGHLNEEERKLIDQIFEFSETTVKEAMIPRTEVIAVPETANFDEIAKAFADHGYSRLPVYGTSMDDIAGFIHSKDLIAFAKRTKSFNIADVLHKPSYVVDTARLEDVLRQMQKEKFHFGFVVDEHGGVEGIITLEDLLEEIVGDISDEHDVEVDEQIQHQSDGRCVLDGGLAVRDLNKRLEMNLPVSESYTTIAGLLMSESGRILEEEEVVKINGHTFTIEKVDKHRISLVRMSATPKIETEPAS